MQITAFAFLATAKSKNDLQVGKYYMLWVISIETYLTLKDLNLGTICF